MMYKIIDNKMLITVDEKFDNKTLDDFLSFYKHSRKNKYLLIRDNKILINNDKVNLNYLLKMNDIIEIKVNQSLIDYVPEKYELDIVYEDDIVLIVNKPYDLIVHDKTNSLANKVAYYYNVKNYKIPVRHLHRLDRDTQGLIMYCKVEFFQPYLDYMLANKKIERRYKAIVYGKLTSNITINNPIGKDRHVNNKYRISKTGLNAITHVKKLKHKNNYSLVECILETGRTHQIRVHLSSINLFIVNDVIYGKKSKDFKCMGLISYYIKFLNPITQKENIVILNNNVDLDYFEKF